MLNERGKELLTKEEQKFAEDVMTRFGAEAKAKGTADG